MTATAGGMPSCPTGGKKGDKEAPGLCYNASTARHCEILRISKPQAQTRGWNLRSDCPGATPWAELASTHATKLLLLLSDRVSGSSELRKSCSKIRICHFHQDAEPGHRRAHLCMIIGIQPSPRIPHESLKVHCCLGLGEASTLRLRYELKWPGRPLATEEVKQGKSWPWPS